MMIRPLLLATLFAAAAVPAVAQDYGSGYDDRRAAYDDRRDDIRSVRDFEAPLARYGKWVPSRYGRAWSPRVARDWRPYTVGRWVEDADGWEWNSDEPWGWATYHYGRWGFDDRWGWVWVPDTEWGPGWVTWRDGDDYAGWAPLPPRTAYGSEIDSWDYDRWYAPSWVYVPRSALYSGGIAAAILPWRDNRRQWDRTRGNRQFHDRGPRRSGRDGWNGQSPQRPNDGWQQGRPPQAGTRPQGRPPQAGDQPGGRYRDGRPVGRPDFGDGRPGERRDVNDGRPDRDRQPGGFRPDRGGADGQSPRRPRDTVAPTPAARPIPAEIRPDRIVTGGRGPGNMRRDGDRPAAQRPGGDRPAAQRPSAAPAAPPAAEPAARPDRASRPSDRFRNPEAREKPE